MFNLKVNLETQLGTAENVNLDDVRAILSPALKRFPPDAAEKTKVPADPHYVCSLTSELLEGRFDLLTQFGREVDRDVLGPLVLCSPALKNLQKRRLRALEEKFPHLTCFAIEEGQSPAVRVNVTTQFGFETGTNQRGVNVGTAQLLCMPANKTASTALGTGALEADQFPNFTAQLTIKTPFGSDTVVVSGPATVLVDLLPLHADRNGLDEVRTEILSMELSGASKLLGPIAFRLRSPSRQPLQISIGEIEETINITPGRLDTPPLAPTGSGTNFFDVFFEIELLAPPSLVPPVLRLLHNDTPNLVRATITQVPLRAGEAYVSTQAIPLLDESDNPTGISISNATYAPIPMGIQK
jgi:hypothetical protein